jgi:NAD(P)-dependent dehydrogenase (short-subunit alcohol dehydrogenase family)
MTVRLDLEGRCGLVIGGTSEIGRACVKRLGEEGMTVGFTAGNRQLGESVARESGGSLIECDHRDRASCDRAIEQALELGGGRLDVLVTNGGMLFDGSIESTPEAVFRELLEVNLTSPFRVARACLAPMRAQGGGSMIHIASDAGIRAAHETAAYSVTSAGLIALAELFAAEAVADSVRCNAVCPGDGAAAGDVASLVAWLACDQSAHMTGATLRLDGGSGAAMVVDTRA